MASMARLRRRRGLSPRMRALILAYSPETYDLTLARFERHRERLERYVAGVRERQALEKWAVGLDLASHI